MLKIYALSGSKTRLVLEQETLLQGNMSVLGASISEELKENEFLVAELISETGETARGFYKQGILEIAPVKDDTVEVLVQDSCIKLKANEYVHAVEIETEVIIAEKRQGAKIVPCLFKNTIA